MAPWLLWSSAQAHAVRTHLHGHAFAAGALPFDAANPTFPPEAVAASPGLGLAVPAAPDLAVFGAPPDAPPGPPPSGPTFPEVAGAAFAAARRTVSEAGAYPPDFVAAAERERAAGRWHKALAVISLARVLDPVEPGRL